MNTKGFTISRFIQRILFAFPLLFSMSGSFAQAPDCTISDDHGLGYLSTIESVVDLGGGDYGITLSVYFNGCPGPGCKNVSYVGLEMADGTYSDVTAVAYVGGDSISASINQGGLPFSGVKISGLGDFGKVNDAILVINYVLTGGFQSQQTVVKAASFELYASFSAADFAAVFACMNTNIFPYYPPPTGGKLLNSIIGPELNSLYYVYDATGTAVSDNIFQIAQESGIDYVLIKVFAVSSEQLPVLEANLLSEGLYTGSSEVLNDYKIVPGQLSISGWFPINKLTYIDTLIGVALYARPEYTPQVNTGYIQSQGDAAMRSEVSRSIFGLSGEGLKIGVLSDSYNSKPDNPAYYDVLNKDLPGAANTDYPTPVQVLKDFPVQASDEGRAMLQIIHDIAPAAELAFRTGFISEYDFASGVYDLQDAGCDVIVDDITHITEPFFRDGIITQAIENVVQGKDVSGNVVYEPVAYFVSAGNFGEKSYENIFSGEMTTIDGKSGYAHNFATDGTSDITQGLTVYEGNYLIVLQWDDDFGGATHDFDIYLAQDSQSTLFGFNRDNLGGNPIEVLPFTVGPTPAGADPTTTNIIVINENADEPVRFKYVVFRGELNATQPWEYEGLNKSTIVGHANAASAITVGAMGFNNYPDFNNTMIVEPFSSHGGTPVYTSSNTWETRQKPDLVGPDGAYTSLNFGIVVQEPQGDVTVPRYPFYGTSAAAPHAAAVGALVMEAYKKFYDVPLSPAGLKARMVDNAHPIPGSSAWESGAGYFLADEILQSFANPAPIITGLDYDPESQPGVFSVYLDVNGGYLDPAAEILVNGVAISSTVSTSGDAISGIIPPDDDGLLEPEDLYPIISVYNPPQAGTNGSDGGESNALTWVANPTIQINIDSKIKKYAESLPTFTATYYLVDNGTANPLTPELIGEEAYNRIMEIGFEIPQDPEGQPQALYNAGGYPIFADLLDPLNPDNELEAPALLPVEESILENYSIVIVDGDLVVERLDVSIIPEPVTYTYGQILGSADLNFTLDYDESITIEPSVVNAIMASYSTGLANVLATSTGLANALQAAAASSTGLANFNSFMISTNAMNSVNVSSTGLANTYIEIGPIDGFENLVYDPVNPQLYWATSTIANAQNTASASSTGLANAQSLMAASSTGLANGQYAASASSTGLANGNSTGLANSSTINGDSNSDVLFIFNQEDMETIAGGGGTINMVSIHIVTSTDAGTHWIVPGVFLSTNMNISYLSAQVLNILPAAATISFEPSYNYTYDGSPHIPVPVITGPDGNVLNLAIEYTFFDESGPMEGPPTEAGSYTVTATIAGTEGNYVGNSGAPVPIVIDPMTVEVVFDEASLTQTYDGTSRNAVAMASDIEGTPLPLVYEYYLDNVLMESAPVNAGSYTVKAFVSADENNYTGETGDPVGMTILKATATVQIAEGAVFTYNGTPQSPVATVTGLTGETLTLDYDLVYSYEYAGAPYSGVPVNAEVYTVYAEIAAEEQNYEGNSGTPVPYTILKATVYISFDEAYVYTYTGSPQSPTGTVADGGGNAVDLTEPLVYAYELSGEPFIGVPTDAGDYTVYASVSADEQNYSGNSGTPVPLMINKATVSVQFDASSLTQVYDGNPKYAGASATDLFGGALELSIDYYDGSGGLLTEAPTHVAASNYSVTATVINAMNYEGSATAPFIIEKALLTLSIDPPVDFMFEDGELPDFGYMSVGFVDGDNLGNSLQGLTYTIAGLNYGNPQAGEYDVVPFATAVNYSIDFVNGTLYVNPSGPGTKHIIPKVICVDPYGDNLYIATFEYTNNNNSSVYIPIGEDNYFESVTNYWSVLNPPPGQPEVFLPGVHYIDIVFDGEQLTWTVASYNHKGQKAAQGSSASSSSSSCTKTSEVEPEDLTVVADGISAYPNPTSDKVMLLTNGNDVAPDDIAVYDIRGNSVKTGNITPSGQGMVIDLSNQESGVYIIRVNLDTRVEIVRIIKQ